MCQPDAHYYSLFSLVSTKDECDLLVRTWTHYSCMFTTGHQTLLYILMHIYKYTNLIMPMCVPINLINYML